MCSGARISLECPPAYTMNQNAITCRIFRFGLIFAIELSCFAGTATGFGLSERAPVAPFWNGKLPDRLLDRGEFIVVNAFPNLTFEDPIGIVPQPHSTRLWVYG